MQRKNMSQCRWLVFCFAAVFISMLDSEFKEVCKFEDNVNSFLIQNRNNQNRKSWCLQEMRQSQGRQRIFSNSMCEF